MLDSPSMTITAVPHPIQHQAQACTPHPAPESLAGLFKACGDPLRLEILRLLERDAFGVLELCALLGVRQSAMSHHLKVLSQAGLVETQREGNSIFYRRSLAATTPRREWLQAVFRLVDGVPLAAETAGNLTQVRRQRAEQSLQFFARHADDLQLQQEKVAEYALYAGPVAQLIAQIKRPDWRSVLEVGPGDGRFLLTLAEHFDTVIALDNSTEMLARARQRVESQGCSSISFIDGDTSTALASGLRVDLIVMNMVLHHVPSPQAMLHDCGQLLNPGGSLVLCDLSHHDQQWTRDACGDLWLGFADSELEFWAGQCGLDAGESLYLGVRNGFQVQIRQFIRTAPACDPTVLDPAVTTHPP